MNFGAVSIIPTPALHHVTPAAIVASEIDVAWHSCVETRARPLRDMF
jgi:hypothetical protein